MSELNLKAAQHLGHLLSLASEEQLTGAAKQWVPAVRKEVGLSRIEHKRWGRILDLGVEEKLFVLEGDSREGKLSPMPKQKPSPKKVSSPKPPKKVVSEDSVSPMRHLDCGHWNYQQVPVEPPDSKSPGKFTPQKTVLVKHPKDCPACEAGKPGDPRYQKGKWQKPVPESMRRNRFSNDSPGYQGLCSDPETGLYIGGVGNDCRYNSHNGGTRCIHHAK